MIVPAITVGQGAPPLAATSEPAAWSKAARVEMRWDIVRAQRATEATSAWIATDGTSLFVRFDAAQRETVAATQHTNDIGLSGDDAVWIDLWPAGSNGYMYQFQATPNGTHFETSSENTAYSPTWESYGAVKSGAYTVTMRIPLDVMRGVRFDHPWKAQFVRLIHATGEEQVWAFDATQTKADDYAKAGVMTLPAAAHGPKRPKSRFAPYALAAAGPRTIGGTTSRVGLDLSVPIAPTTSLYATFHPDYSNVELDQQTIVPSVYARYYAEVRPFFTQAAGFYNYDLHTVVWPNSVLPLYTPAIPTPREGYAVEGKEGPLSFASFDAIGDGRSDLASAFTYTSPDQRWNTSVQRVSADTTALVDDTSSAFVGYNDLHHLSAFLNYGSDSGTNVLDGSQAQWYDGGAIWENPTFAFAGAMRKVGQYFNPVDGFTAHPGIAGYGLFAAKFWDFAPSSKAESISVNGYIDRYQGPTMGIAQSDNQIMVDLLTRNAWDFQVFSGSDYWRFGSVLTAVSQSAGFSVTYDSGLQTNNPSSVPSHGPSATPTTIALNTGRYGDGTLDTWFRTSTIRVGSRGAVSLTLDDTAQYLPHAPNNVQWFDSLSYSYQVDRNSSFAIGLRRVDGTPPDPNGGGNCIGQCSNVSLAYHLRMRHAELYAAYGNPNSLTTIPQTIVKLIFYAGAEKGT